MIRRAHRTLIGKLCAACLLVFAASPITAPFTTCDLSDFTQSHPSDTGHHPGRQMAELKLKVASPLVTAAAAIPAVLPVATTDGGRVAVGSAVPAYIRADLRTVLRL